VAAYSFDEGSGTTVADASGNEITGSVQGGTRWTTAGRYGGALLFDGSSSYVDLGNTAPLQLTGSMTWSAWMQSLATPTSDVNLIAKSDGVSGWQLKTTRTTGPRTFAVAVSGPNGFAQRHSTSTRLVGVWYHVAGVYNATAQTLDIYINGRLDNGALSGTVPASQVDSPVNVNIGRRSGGFHFNGVIDNVRIYNRPLSQTEVQSDMNTAVVLPLIVRDNFDRADGSLGPNWASDFSWGPGLAISGGKATTTNAGASYWTANTFDDDQYSQVRLSGPVQSWSALFVRGDARPQGYYMAVIKSDGTYLYSSFALLGHDATTWATGDISRLAVRTVAPGLARLVLYRNGSPIFSYDDADHFVASGRPGIGLSAGTEGISLDDWEAGELISAP
jgi:hypothetical protein